MDALEILADRLFDFEHAWVFQRPSELCAGQREELPRHERGFWREQVADHLDNIIWLTQTSHRSVRGLDQHLSLTRLLIDSDRYKRGARRIYRNLFPGQLRR